jgi:hypothetical protein
MQIRVGMFYNPIGVISEHDVAFPNRLSSPSSRDSQVFTTAHREEKGHVC